NVYKYRYCYHKTKIPYGAIKYGKLARRIAIHYGLNPSIFMAQIECESLWNEKAISSDKGYGLCQITPRVLKNKKIEKAKLFDPEYNLIIGAQIKLYSWKKAKKICQKFNCNCLDKIALRIYNGGSKYLIKELNYLDEKNLICNWNNILKVCARDLCLWWVNIYYVIKVENSAKKYKFFVQ
ncbi:MAG TPA: hypothetical protein ENG63_02325, partial [Candidatus Desulfofervidus auxilii]|nr:hypothetical protein [Candidatus Desulfofervidus auxilii]